jgi:hypothetical protein
MGAPMAKPRDYDKEYREYHSKPEQRRRNDGRKQARRNMVKIHGKGKLAGKDVDHKNGNARDNSPSNLKIRSVKANRGDKK